MLFERFVIFRQYQYFFLLLFLIFSYFLLRSLLLHFLYTLLLHSKKIPWDPDLGISPHSSSVRFLSHLDPSVIKKQREKRKFSLSPSGSADLGVSSRSSCPSWPPICQNLSDLARVNKKTKLSSKAVDCFTGEHLRMSL
jgi:hypothetical protein